MRPQIGDLNPKTLLRLFEGSICAGVQDTGVYIPAFERIISELADFSLAEIQTLLRTIKHSQIITNPDSDCRPMVENLIDGCSIFFEDADTANFCSLYDFPFEIYLLIQ